MRSRSTRFVPRRCATSSTFPAVSGACPVVTLDRNYRSTRPILDAANGVIASPGRASPSISGPSGLGRQPTLITVRDDADQARS